MSQKIHHLSSLCVFCGSNYGIRHNYRETAASLGRFLAEMECRLIYGGGNVGLMGVVANAVLAAGGEVIGVIPQALATKELAHPGLTKMHVVPGMHARKALMADLADGFVAMPGGFGTFEELLEIITWALLGIHHKPIGLLNAAGYFDGLTRLIEHAIEERFIKPEYRGLFVIAEDPRDLVHQMETHRMPKVRKWIKAEET